MNWKTRSILKPLRQEAAVREVILPLYSTTRNFIMKQSPDNITTNTGYPLKILCDCLGQIPIDQPSIPDGIIPVDWDVYSAVDWERLVSIARDQGFGPLVYWLLSQSRLSSSLPEEVRSTLRSLYARTLMNNQRILNELETLAQAFKQAGIPLVVLKGACFTQTIYPDIGLRPMGDLDVFVPGGKRAKADQIARSLGYDDQEPEASRGLNDLIIDEILLKKTTFPSIFLEIHLGLVAGRSVRYAIPVDWFWEQIEPLDSSVLKARDLELFMLTPTAQVLYAAAHAMLKHGGKISYLCWFYDLDRIIRYYSERLDWDLLLAQAKKFEWGSALNAALSKTVTYFNTPIPEYVLTNLSEIPDRHRRLVALKQTQPATHILGEFQKLQSLNWYGRYRLTLALIAPNPAYMRWRYKLKNQWVLPAYYLIRWWGILKDGFRSLVSLLKNGSPKPHG